MQDLTQAFVSALALSRDWNLDYIATDAAGIMKQLGGYFTWEREAGEQWMYLNGPDHERYALLWTQAPLAIVTSKVSTALRKFLLQHEVKVVEADDWDATAYSIDPAIVRAHGMPDFWGASPWSVPVRAFSILDLVWATL